MEVSVFNHQRFYEHLDEAVCKAGVQNAAGFPVKGFPFLRANRFFIGLRALIIDEHQKELWIQLLRRYDLIERAKEIQNLPNDALAELASRLPKKASSREELFERLQFYSERFMQSEQLKPKFYDRVKKAAVDPGVYSLAMRVFGFYPLVYPAAVFFTKRAYREIAKLHGTPVAELPVKGSLTPFIPSKRIDFSSVPLQGMLNANRRNSLGMPELSKEEVEIIADVFAPVVSVDIAAEYDRFGEVLWKDGHVLINTAEPVLYYYPSYTLIQEKVYLQMNYSFWYPGRYGSNVPLVERGPLDGVTIRVTIDENGIPLMVDCINNCGAYYFAVPHKKRVTEVITRPHKPGTLIPSWLPPQYPHEPLHVQIGSGRHQVRHVDSGIPELAHAYRLLPYEALETLKHLNGHSESVFNEKGLMKDSWRIEPYLFFSMGIPKVGYMRQRGNHAIKTAGRAHFTDPDVYDRGFVFNPIPK